MVGNSHDGSTDQWVHRIRPLVKRSRFYKLFLLLIYLNPAYSTHCKVINVLFELYEFHRNKFSKFYKK